MTKDASLAYLLVYAASIDLNISEKEKKHLLSQFADSEMLEKIQEDFETDDEFEKVEKVQSIIAKYGNTENSKAELLTAIKELIATDNGASAIEQSLMRLIKLNLD